MLPWRTPATYATCRRPTALDDHRWWAVGVCSEAEALGVGRHRIQWPSRPRIQGLRVALRQRRRRSLLGRVVRRAHTWDTIWQTTMQRRRRNCSALLTQTSSMQSRATKRTMGPTMTLMASWTATPRRRSTQDLCLAQSMCLPLRDGHFSSPMRSTWRKCELLQRLLLRTSERLRVLRESVSSVEG